MKYHKLFAVFLSCVLATPALSNCPGPGCPAQKGLLGAINSGVAAGIISPKPKPERPQVRATGNSQAPVERERVRGIQTALNHFGFDAGPVDGLPGVKTRAAIRRFQASRNFPETGILSAGEEEILRSEFRNSQKNR